MALNLQRGEQVRLAASNRDSGQDELIRRVFAWPWPWSGHKAVSSFIVGFRIAYTCLNGPGHKGRGSLEREESRDQCRKLVYLFPYLFFQVLHAASRKDTPGSLVSLCDHPQ